MTTLSPAARRIVPRSTTRLGTVEVDPEIAGFARALMTPAESPEVSIVELRSRARTVRLPWNTGGPEMATTRDAAVATRSGTMPVRIYEPPAMEERTVVYFHGGGWTLLGIDTHDRIMREIAAAARCRVIGLDFPLAPEHPFPQAIHDCSDALDALARLRLGGLELSTCVLVGDSAGANLALALTLYRRDAGLSLPAALSLYCSVCDADLGRASYIEFGDGSLPLPTARMAWFWDQYCPDPAVRCDPFASPLRASLVNLPPIQLIVAAHDILRDENIAMYEALAGAGNRAEIIVFEGATHAFIEAVARSEHSRAAIVATSDWVSRWV